MPSTTDVMSEFQVTSAVPVFATFLSTFNLDPCASDRWLQEGVALRNHFGSQNPIQLPPSIRSNTKSFCIFLSWTEHQLIREVFLELGSLAGMVCYFSFQACPSIGIHSHPNSKRDPRHAGPVPQRAFLGLKDRHCHGWIWIWTSSQWLSWSNNHTLQPSKSVLRLKHVGATVEGDCGQVNVMIYYILSLYIVMINGEYLSFWRTTLLDTIFPPDLWVSWWPLHPCRPPVFNGLQGW